MRKTGRTVRVCANRWSNRSPHKRSFSEVAMIARLTRLSVLAAVAVLAQPLTASADERNAPIRPGVYDGVWHTDKVKIIVEEVGKDGTFSGSVRFDKDSRWPDYRFDFNGQIGRRDELTITRVGDNCTQVAHASAPRQEGRSLVWKGDVAGDGLDRPYAFEMCVPERR
jgi:hypothetical protein